MEIIDTVMIGAPPLWLLIIFGISVVICLFCVLAGINTPNHEEYIVRLTDISTTEFIENWEVTKEFEYSDVIQVKKKEKKQ